MESDAHLQMVLQTVDALHDACQGTTSDGGMALRLGPSDALRTFQLFSQPVNPHLNGLLPPRSPPWSTLLWSESSLDVTYAFLLVIASSGQQSR